MNITTMTKQHIPEAAVLFAQSYKKLRASVCCLPTRMEDPDCTGSYLDNLLTHSSAVAALEEDRLVGYLGWWLVEGFRGTRQKAAYCPVWAHSTGGQPSRIYRELYRAASSAWLAAGCQTHAISLLAHEAETQKTWFWNGFGLTVVDAVRSLDAINIAAPDGYTLRQAVLADAPVLAEIEAEHWRHYAEPPTLMVVNGANTTEEFVQLIAVPENRVWVAWKGQELAGYLRFEGISHGATEIVRDEGTTAITGAYVRPAHRGQRIAGALLDAALADYKAAGFTRCSVDFESFNPEAAAFWPRYFSPVCYSVVRVPERG